MIILTFIFILMLCFFPAAVSKSVSDSMDMCLKSVIPSLFPFVVCSDIIVKSLNEKNNCLWSGLSKLFNISSISVWSFIPGILCGYPVGGKIALDLYNEKLITECEKDRLLIFANNAGPGFVIGMVGGVLFNDYKTGALIYLCHILSSVTYGIVSGLFKRTLVLDGKKKSIGFSVSHLIIEGIKNGMESMINITGVICFFSAVISLIDLIPFISLFKYKGFIFGLFEITNGIKLLIDTAFSYEIKCAITGFLLSFSGLSVFMQLKTFSDKIKIAAYFSGKLLCGILSFFYCLMLL